MKSTAWLFVALATAASVPLACGGGGGSVFDDGTNDEGDGGGSLDAGDPTFQEIDGSNGEGGSGAAQNLESLRIEPENATIEVNAGQSATQAFRVFGKLKGATTEVDITERSVFYTPAGYLVGRFPANGGPLFTTLRPQAAGDPPQRGGVVTIEAKAANSDGTISTATTLLHVKLVGALPAPSGPLATPPIPANPGSLFANAPTAPYAPQLVYPNDGVMLPPNLRRLEVHFGRGNAANKLFEVSFVSAQAEIRYYTRCASSTDAFDEDACVLELDEATYAYVAESNRGAGPLKLRVRGTDEVGHVGQSSEFTVEFAENRVDGAVYYWTATSPSRIIRFDFGGTQTEPEAFLQPSDLPSGDGQCIGCHALSRDGKRMFAGVGNSSVGRLVYINDLATPRSNPAWLDVNGGTNTAPSNTNRVLTGSFSPDGAQFVAVAPVNDADSPPERLHFHSGTTGLRTSSLDLDFTPASPDWSPDGSMIALTKIGGTNATTIEFYGGSISLIKKSGNAFTKTETVVAPKATNRNRYNPVFAPDSSFLLFSESQCDQEKACNGYADPTARTVAAKPEADATLVPLARASARGVNDGSNTNLMDTFPKMTPFKTDHRGKKLFWFTVGSQRRAGLRKFFPNPSAVGDPATQQLLWMFAIDPEKILAGEDGSYPGFFLPFQDLKTSNHMAQWAEKIVSDVTPPPPNPPPPPPPVPPPPPPPR